MDLFPHKPYRSVATYFDDYAMHLEKALSSVERSGIDNAVKLICDTIEKDKHIFACGNGGSSSIANHLVCDLAKGVSTRTNLKPRVRSFSSPIEIISAYANDVGYAHVYVEQAKLFARKGDLILSISSSGESDNVINLVKWAKANGVKTIAMTGFSGGRLREIVDLPIHVDAFNYGIVEDVHQSIVHAVAQFIRSRNIEKKMISKEKF